MLLGVNIKRFLYANNNNNSSVQAQLKFKRYPRENTRGEKKTEINRTNV